MSPVDDSDQARPRLSAFVGVMLTAGDMKHPFASGGLKFSDVWTEGLGLRRADLCDKTPPRLETDNLTHVKKVLRVPRNITKRSPSGGE